MAVIGLLTSLVLVNTSNAREKARLSQGLQFSSSIMHALGDEAVGIWSFDQGGTAVDTSGYGNNGTINGAVSSAGVIGQALTFDGLNNYVDCGTSTSLNLIDKVTWGGWVKRTGPSKNSWDGIMGHDTYQLDEPGTSYSTIYCTILGDDGNYKGTNTYDIGYNKWHHVMCKFDSSLSSGQLQLWVDGILRGNVSWNGKIQSHPENHFVVGSQGGLNGNFNGVIDEVQIYSVAFSALEIQQHYAQGLGKHQDLAIK
jgi:hypothetical protein